MSQDAAINIALRLVDQATAPMNKAMAMVERSTMVAEKRMRMLDGAAKAMVGTFAALGISLSMVESFKTGFDSVEKFKVSVAEATAFITTFSEKAAGGDLSGGFKDANEYAKRLVVELENIDAKTIASGKDLVAMSNTMMQNGVLLDIDNKKQVQGFINIANALSLVTAGQNKDVQIRQEINALMQGQIRDTDRLPKLLAAIDPQLEEHLKLWKAQGTTVEHVGDMLKGFGASAALIEETWLTVGSSLETVRDKVLRDGFAPIFKDILGFAQDIRNSLIDTSGQLTPLAVNIQKSIGGAYKSLKLGAMEVRAEILRIGILLDKTGGTMSFLASLPSAIPAAIGVKSSQDRMERLANYNIMFENRAAEKDAALLRLAEQYNAVEETGFVATKTSKASAPGIRASSIIDETAERSAKKYAAALDEVLARALPLRAEQQKYAADVKLLDELLGKHRITTDEYQLALANLWAGTKQADEADRAWAETIKKQEQDQKDLAKVRSAYDEAVLSSLPDQERAVASLANEYGAYQQAVVDAGAAGEISMEEVYKRLDMLDARQADATTKAIEGFQKKNDQIRKIWDHTFENLQDITADWLYNMKISWSSLGDLFRKMVSQMVAAWAWGQASMAWGSNISATGAAGGGGNSAADTMSTGISLLKIGDSLATGLGNLQTSAANLAANLGWGTAGTYGATLAADAPMFGAASFYSTAAADGAYLGASEAITMSGLAEAGYTTTGSGAAGGIADMSSQTFGAWTAGIGTFIMSLLNGESFRASAAKGVGAGGGFVAGAEMGSSFGPWGAAIGGVVGAVLGALGMGSIFGDKENKFTLTELSGYTDSSWNSTSGFDQSTFKHGPAGNEWYRDIADGYVASMNAVQKKFNEDVDSIRNKMSEGVKTAFDTALASKTFDDVNEGRFYVHDAQGVIVTAVSKYAESLQKGIEEALLAALPALALELVGENSSFAVLNEGLQEAIKATINSGTFTVDQFGQVQGYLDKISQATTPIQEIIDTKGMSEYELSLRSINKQFDGYAAQLKAAGVDLTKYTQLEEARTIALDKAAESTSRLTEEARKYADALATAEDNLRSAYEREASVFRSTIEQFTRFAVELRKFKDGLLLGNLSTLSPEAKYAEARRQFESVANRAKLGDADAIGLLQGVSQAFLEASQGYYASTADYVADFLKVSEVLDSTASVAERHVSIAQQQLNALTNQVSALITINQSVLSVREAIAALNLSKNAAASAGVAAALTGAPTSVTSPSALPGTVMDMYTAALGREADPAGLVYWSVELAKAGGDINAIKEDFFASAAGYGENVKRFAAGGDHYGGYRIVGEHGPELEATGPARIYNAADTRRMLFGGSDEETKALLKQILAELRADKTQRGAVGVATIGKLDAVVDRLDGTKREIRRQVA